MMHHLSFLGVGDWEREQGSETMQSTFQARMRGSGKLSGKTTQRSLRGWVEQFGTTVTPVGYGSAGRQNCRTFPGKEARVAEGTGSENYAIFQRRSGLGCGILLAELCNSSRQSSRT